MSQTMIRPAQQDVYAAPSASATTTVSVRRALIALAGAAALASVMVYLVSLVIGLIGA